MQARHIVPTRRGFTFVELAIAVLVMGIMAAVAVPSYLSTVTNFRVDMAARKIIADLNYARAEAERTSQSRSVLFSSVGNSYTLTNVSDLDHSGDAYKIELVDAPFSSFIVGASFGGDEEVIFDMFGVPDTIGTVVVQSGSVQKTVNLAVDGTATATP